MYLKVFVVVSKPVIPTGPLPDFYQKIDHTLVTSDILPLNDWIVYESIFWLSLGEYQTIDRQRMTAVARSLWKDWNFHYFEDRLANLGALVRICSVLPILIHTGDGGDSSDVGFVALQCKTFVLLGFETTLSLPGGGFLLELRPTYEALEMWVCWDVLLSYVFCCIICKLRKNDVLLLGFGKIQRTPFFATSEFVMNILTQEVTSRRNYTVGAHSYNTCNLNHSHEV